MAKEIVRSLWFINSKMTVLQAGVLCSLWREEDISQMDIFSRYAKWSWNSL